nr:MAM and LDL-receptor class A domain-containing protein 1-like [Pocillopora verrucosa]
MNLSGNFQVQILTFGGLLFVLSILTASTGGNVLILPVPTPPQDGGPVTQGDLRQITPDSNEAKINEVLGYTGPDILLGDIISDAETLRFITQDPNSRNAITYPHGLWPSNTVPYIIDKSIGQQGVKAINDAIKDYHSQTCLKFVSRTTQKNYIRFTVGDGCSSSIGRTARGEQKINLHRGCWFKGVVIHEIAHAIGFFHEQSRSDRDSYVKILYENIQKGVEDNFQKFDQGEIQHLGEPYDYSSIMHYGPNDFTRNGRPTIMGLRSGSNQMGQRKGFSANDVRQINKLYKCPAKPVAPGPDENSVEYCNFDSGSLCDFTQATGDQFDWTLHKGPTRTGGTGPGTDMSGKGYYVYIETSTPRRKGDRAVLLSPRLKGPYCLRMHYHMLGVNIGSLRVYKNSTSGNSVVFSVDGNKGDQWYSAEYSLTGPEQFQLAFEAVRGNGYRGDIALDEIKLVPGKCNASPGTPAPPVIKTPVKQKTTPEPPTRGEVYCNFDSRTFCQFTQTTADEFDWVLNKGNTPSAPQTGPRSDVSSTGYYIYAEASFPRQNGDRAQLLSPKLIGSYCLQFYYYMHGAQMGALHVLLVLGARRFKQFSYTGDQGQKWHKAEIDNWGKHAYQLGFEAERGIGNTGDIALDEIRLKPGSCNQFKVSTQPPTTIKTTPLVTQEYCNFDSGSLCDLTQATGDQFDWTLHKGPTSTGGTGPGTDMSGKGQLYDYSIFMGFLLVEIRQARRVVK